MAKGVDALTSGNLEADHGERAEVKMVLDMSQRIRAASGGSQA